MDRIQNDDSFFNKELNRLKRGTEEERDLANTIENLSSLSVAPYANINVCDAQVCIRPALYRKLRIAVGEWSFEPNEDGYSDEIAYNILEKDNSWMTSPKKCAIVNKFQLKPLKMVYFANDPQLMF